MRREYDRGDDERAGGGDADDRDRENADVDERARTSRTILAQAFHAAQQKELFRERTLYRISTSCSILEAAFDAAH